MGDSVPVMNRVSRRLGHSYRSDGPVWGSFLLIADLLTKFKGHFYGWLLNAPGLRWGKGNELRGIRFISIGTDVQVHSYLWMEAISSYQQQRFNPRIRIGHRVSFSSRVHITCIHEITICSGCLIGSNVYISDHNHGLYKGADQSSPKEPPGTRRLSGGPVVISENVWIGDNVIIIGPVSIGAGAIIGANSVITKSVPASTIVVGSPGRIIKKFNHEEGSWESV